MTYFQGLNNDNLTILNIYVIIQCLGGDMTNSDNSKSFDSWPVLGQLTAILLTLSAILFGCQFLYNHSGWLQLPHWHIGGPVFWASSCYIIAMITLLELKVSKGIENTINLALCILVGIAAGMQDTRIEILPNIFLGIPMGLFVCMLGSLAIKIMKKFC